MSSLCTTFDICARLADATIASVTASGTVVLSNEFASTAVCLWDVAKLKHDDEAMMSNKAQLPFTPSRAAHEKDTTTTTTADLKERCQAHRLCEDPLMLATVANDERDVVAFLCLPSSVVQPPMPAAPTDASRSSFPEGGCVLKLMSPHGHQSEGTPWRQPATLVANVDIAQLLDGHRRPAAAEGPVAPPQVTPWRPAAMSACVATSLQSPNDKQHQVAILWTPDRAPVAVVRLVIIAVPKDNSRVATTADVTVVTDIVFHVDSPAAPPALSDEAATRNQVFLTSNTTCIFTVVGQQCLTIVSMAPGISSSPNLTADSATFCEFPHHVKFQEGITNTALKTPQRSLTVDVMITAHLSAAIVHVASPSSAAPASSSSAAVMSRLFVGSLRPKVIHVYNIDPLVMRLKSNPAMLLTRPPEVAVTPPTAATTSARRQQLIAHDEAIRLFWNDVETGGLRRNSDLAVMWGGAAACLVAANPELDLCVTADVLPPQSRYEMCVQTFNLHGSTFATSSRLASNEASHMYVASCSPKSTDFVDDRTVMSVCWSNMPTWLYRRLTKKKESTAAALPPAKKDNDVAGSEANAGVVSVAPILLLTFKRRTSAVAVCESGEFKEIAVWRVA